MRYQNLTEEPSEMEQMALRRLRRDIISGRLSPIPKIFRDCIFRDLDAEHMRISVIIVPESVSATVIVNPRRVDVSPACLNSVYEQDQTARFLAEKFGQSFAITGSSLVRSPRTGRIVYSYTSEEFQEYLRDLFTPWRQFIVYRDNDSSDLARIDWLHRNAGKTVKPEQLLYWFS